MPLNKFKFLISGLGGTITEKHPVWKCPLPENRYCRAVSGRMPVSCGDYFTAARAFLSSNHFHSLVSSIYQQTKTSILPEAIESVFIVLEKHGEFYHPAKIRVLAQKRRFEFVLNVAVSKAGLDCIENEFKLLKKLHRDCSWNFIPEAYEKNAIRLSIQAPRFEMFLGEWFSGFNEFHVHSTGRDKFRRIEVWDYGRGNYFLSEKHAYELYCQTAMILTCYFNLATFERIHPWHHAAGDFVVKIQEDHPKVKLVTVRGYNPLICSGKKNTEPLVETLAFFLMDLSIRNRIDRYSGTGGIAWADDVYVMATIDGFFKGLEQKIHREPGFAKLMNRLCETLDSLNVAGMENLFTRVILSWPRQAPELKVIVDKIKSHAMVFEFFMREFLSKYFVKN